MYSMILMASLAGGTAAPDWGHHRNGGYAYACSGCFGCTCHGPAYGGYGGYPVYMNQGGYGCGGYGCYGFNCYGNTGTYGCYGPAFYGHGHVYGCHGGYGCWGYYGCYGNWSCYGMIQGSPYHAMPAPGQPGQVPTPAPGKEPEKVPAPTKDKDKDEIKKGELSPRANLVVELPEDAKLYIDDQPTKSPSSRRVFQTPPLQAGETYFYVLRAEIVRDGQTMSQTQRVVLRPGEESRADFTSLSTTSVTQAGR